MAALAALAIPDQAYAARYLITFSGHVYAGSDFSRATGKDVDLTGQPVEARFILTFPTDGALISTSYDHQVFYAGGTYFSAASPLSASSTIGNLTVLSNRERDSEIIQRDFFGPNTNPSDLLFDALSVDAQQYDVISEPSSHNRTITKFISFDVRSNYHSIVDSIDFTKPFTYSPEQGEAFGRIVYLDQHDEPFEFMPGFFQTESFRS